MKKYIPKGVYCYDGNGCRWWRQNKNKDFQQSGYCMYFYIIEFLEEYIKKKMESYAAMGKQELKYIWKCNKCGSKH
ncbi:MAG: hypothetical protein KHZ90_08160 [Veillonella parvula]|uniref:Uncharacterized protein n=1 Tax=Veillonella parvula TaxID=29466 RepID=A0A942WRZ4_VEIPA|nr:hypothetical protein [Veillonella parvula]MBS4893733.1 hypothetical protein [Veillonella parvula]